MDRKGRLAEGFWGFALTLRRFAEEAFFDCENTGDRKGRLWEGLQGCSDTCSANPRALQRLIGSLSCTWVQ